jgi:chorismate dehydratase
MKTKISLVSYLNSAPLGWAFLHGPLRGKFEVIPSLPAKCADQLAEGAVDIGLIPSIEFQRIPGLQIIPNVAIASLAEVRSILLIKPRGVQKIGSVALDTSSRTSVALAKVLLQDRMKIRPEYVPHAPDLNSMLDRCDAALLIGDPALRVRLEDYDVLDLAAEWAQWQQRPFVCAFWACRADVRLPGDLIEAFQEAKQWGLEKRSEIAASFSRPLGLPASFLEDYLLHNIDYDMGPRHIEGLEKFYQLAWQQNLIPELRKLRFITEVEK